MSTVQEHPAPAAPTAAADTGEPPQGNDILVGLILTFIVIAVVVMVGFIWYRWQGVREPTSAIIIDGDEMFDGTIITIRGPRQITATLNKANGYHTTVLVAPGHYLVTIERNGLPLLRKEVGVERFLAPRFDLPEYVRRGGAAADASPPVIETRALHPTAATPGNP